MRLIFLTAACCLSALTAAAQNCPTCLWVDPGLSRGAASLNVSSLSAPPGNLVFIRQDTAFMDNGKTVQIQRVSTDDDGHINPHALSVLYQTNENGDSRSKPWATASTMISNTTRSGVEAGTALSGVARKLKQNSGILFGGHLQVKDETGGETLGGIVGLELNIQGNGPDLNGNRVGMDLIARTFGQGPEAEMTTALRIRSDRKTAGTWATGLKIEDGNAAILSAIDIETHPGPRTGFALRDIGSKRVGLELAGQYGDAAVSIPAGERIALGGGVSIYYDPVTDRVIFEKAGVIRGAVPMN